MMALSVSVSITVHPHARGDNAVGGLGKDRVAGSPPRAWGQLGSAFAATGQTRFTPTRVGTTPRQGARVGQ